MRLFSGRRRPVHLGPYPFESIRRTTNHGLNAPAEAAPRPGALGHALVPVAAIYEGLKQGDVAPGQAPIHRSPAARSELLKSAAYFLDADAVAVCRAAEGYALVIAVQSGPDPEADNRAAEWLTGSQAYQRALAAAEIASVVAGYLRALGFPASAHTQIEPTIELNRLALDSGIATLRGGRLHNPFLGEAPGLAAVTTTLELAVDLPMDPRRRALGAGAWLSWLVGWRGTRSAFERWLVRRRASHLGRYPMERIRRVAEPTTRVNAAEIPQVPLRASFFTRAARGDLGPKAQAQYPNFVMKEPLGFATRQAQAQMIPLLGGVPDEERVELPDPGANARALKSLAYHLGADMVGICQVPRYAWYSHDARGEPIVEQHRYAIVLIVDQGFETMEGASGDDWISGVQSMRAYLRGMRIAVQLALHCRKLGYRARGHSNVDGQVLQIPLMLHAGLGELSRIGEVVLNPFIGPRLKSAVVTTDLPLAVDAHVDFGLQDACRKCRKCARECPCNAISWGDPVMFNGYEMYKPDVERCTRYRLTNSRGAACGRCMKTCPYNNEGLLLHRALLGLAIRFPGTRGWLARLDDKVGNGVRNLVKKWWQDFEIVDGVAGAPRHGVNQRDLSISKQDPRAPIAYYPASVMPPGDSMAPHPVDRRSAVEAVRFLETPAEAERRQAAGEPPPGRRT